MAYVPKQKIMNMGGYSGKYSMNIHQEVVYPSVDPADTDAAIQVEGTVANPGSGWLGAEDKFGPGTEFKVVRGSEVDIPDTKYTMKFVPDDPPSVSRFMTYEGADGYLKLVLIP